MVAHGRNAGGWRPYAALGIGAALALAIAGFVSYPRYPNPPSRDASRAPNHSERAGGEQCREDRFRLITDNAKRARRRAACADAERQEQKDQSAASEARYGSDIAYQTLLVSRYQGWAFFWQALATGAAFIAASFAAWAAYRAFRAAEDTLAHSRDARNEARSGERAWLVPEGDIQIRITNDTTIYGDVVKTTRDGLGFAKQWINSGNTPALDAGCRVAAVLEYRNGDNVIIVPEKDMSADIMNTIVGPGKKIPSPPARLDDAQTRHFRAQQCVIRITYEVKYRDIFTPDKTGTTKIVERLSHNRGNEMIGDDGVPRESISVEQVTGQIIN